MQVPGAVLALLGHRLADQLEGVRLRHQVGVERAGHVGDIDHPRAHRIADLERRHRARAADIVDLDDALAVLVHLLDEALEILRELRAFGEDDVTPRSVTSWANVAGANVAAAIVPRDAANSGKRMAEPHVAQTAGSLAAFCANF